MFEDKNKDPQTLVNVRRSVGLVVVELIDFCFGRSPRPRRLSSLGLLDFHLLVRPVVVVRVLRRLRPAFSEYTLARDSRCEK